MQPIDKAWIQLRKAGTSIEEMVASSSLDEYEDSWKDFLHNLERAWNKVTSQLKKSPKYQGWIERGRTEKLRRKDQLLSYLVNARGAEEHSVTDISKQQAGGIGINPAFGNSLHIKKLEINNGKLSIDSDQPVRIDFIPGRVELLSVENRGRRYEVPSSHLGKDISTNDPVEIARLGILFYEDYFKKAEQHFVK